MEYHCALEPLIRALHRRVHAYDIPSDESVSRNSLYFIRGLQGTYSTDLMGLKEELSFNGAQLNEHVHAIMAKVCKQLPACANRKLGYSYVCYHDHDHDHLSNWLGSASQYSPGRQFPTHTLFTGAMPWPNYRVRWSTKSPFFHHIRRPACTEGINLQCKVYCVLLYEGSLPRHQLNSTAVILTLTII